MSDHDETESQNAVPGAPRPVDFGRRRAARILLRERPRGEQHSWLEFDIGHILEDTMKAYRDSELVPSWSLGDKGRYVMLYFRWRRHALWGGRLIATCYHLRKGKTANLNSRFFGRPS